MTRRLFMLVSVVSFGLVGCATPTEQVGDPTKPFPARSAGKAFVQLYITRGYPVPGQAARSGMLAAVWPDGTIVRATSEADIGKSYTHGHLSPAQLRRLREVLNESDILAMDMNTPVVVDAEAVKLTVRWGDAVSTWAYSPGAAQSGTTRSVRSAIETVKRHLIGLNVADAVP